MPSNPINQKRVYLSKTTALITKHKMEAALSVLLPLKLA